ncbi:MAG: succinate dehydrogenase assembly factor 2 [Methylococcales bacterium]|nr:succinate dehydrogenase assembly factor 2 [Methylococcales bacterium]MBT4033050.1 succinate dehydrogenase assembly factor 2 [Methylococcales bacterium]MBT4348054.1 succinate dehydrogenase assembly factor 2 [Methylococcales bacterium]MBT5953081.1 succinate dehydrogenase assembly factor 2 [Methylococcales bacterium]
MEKDNAKLRWRCRRGSLELDRLLMRYLEQSYPGASDPERLAFEALLALEDLVLARYLFGTQVSTCPIQHRVIKKIAVFQNQ